MLKPSTLEETPDSWVKRGGVQIPLRYSGDTRATVALEAPVPAHPIPEETALLPASGPPAPLSRTEQMLPSAPGAHAACPQQQQGHGPHLGSRLAEGLSGETVGRQLP